MLASLRDRAVAALLASVLLSSSIAMPVHADSKDKAQAQVLFKQGVQLMKDKKYSDACPKFEDSYRLDPQDGTQQQLAACYQELGEWATSIALWQEVLKRAEKANNPQRIQNAKNAIAEIEPKLSHVTVAVPAETRTAGLKIELDDKELAESIWNSPMPIDPGTHVVRASAPDHKRFETKFSVALSAEQKTVTVPRLELTSEPAAVASPAAPAKFDTTPTTEPSKSYTPYAIGAFVVGGVFVGAAIGTRLKFGSEKDDYFAGCAQQTTPTCEDSDGRSRVRTWEALSFVSAGLAIAAIGTGIVLLATDKREKSKTALVGAPTVGGAQLVLTGTF